MKTADFLRENTVIAQESPEDISMVVNNLHTIMRVTADLANRLKGNEELDEWVKEKIAVAKAMMTTVEDYVASQQEMGGEEESLPSFDFDHAERAMTEMIDDEDEAERRIQHLMQKYHWSRQEALEHYHYGKHDPSDWEGLDEGKRTIKENASGGATGSPSIAVSMTALGEKGGFSKADLNKKLGGYGNRLSNVKKVK